MGEAVPPGSREVPRSSAVHEHPGGALEDLPLREGRQAQGKEGFIAGNA